LAIIAAELDAALTMLVRSAGVAVRGETSAGRNERRLSLRAGRGGGVEGGPGRVAMGSAAIAVTGGGPAGGGGITEGGEGMAAGIALAGAGVAGG
jgi:hypothetical protein